MYPLNELLLHHITVMHYTCICNQTKKGGDIHTMDLNSRSARPTLSGVQQTEGPGNSAGPSRKKGKFKGSGKAGQIFYTIFLVAIGVLLLAALFTLIFGKAKSENQYVDSSKIQAVFLNGGQVYFGNITTLNDRYMKINNVYYLRVNNQNQTSNNNTNTTSANDVSLVKLGCELHGPQDAMMITKDQVLFWENLKSDGQVAKAIAEYIKANPNGQKCEENTNNNNSNLQSGGSNPQNNSTGGSTNTNSNTTTPSTNTTRP